MFQCNISVIFVSVLLLQHKAKMKIEIADFPDLMVTNRSDEI